jgi:hypothetical protein
MSHTRHSTWTRTHTHTHREKKHTSDPLVSSLDLALDQVGEAQVALVHFQHLGV